MAKVTIYRFTDGHSNPRSIWECPKVRVLKRDHDEAGLRLTVPTGGKNGRLLLSFDKATTAAIRKALLKQTS